MKVKTSERFLPELLPMRGNLLGLLERTAKGDKTCYREISEILRNLYCPLDGKPFIKTVANGLGFDILVAVHYSSEEEVKLGLLPAELAGHTHFHQVDNVVTWFTCGHELINILEAVNRNEVKLGGRELSYSQIILMASDNLYTPDSEEVVFRILLEMARASVKLIDLLEEKIKDGKYYPYFKSHKKFQLNG